MSPSLVGIDQMEEVGNHGFEFDKGKIAAGEVGYGLIPLNDIRRVVPSINYWKGVKAKSITPDTVRMIAPDDPRLSLRRVKSDIR